MTNCLDFILFFFCFALSFRNTRAHIVPLDGARAESCSVLLENKKKFVSCLAGFGFLQTTWPES